MIQIYSSGLVHCSVCAPADMPVAEVEENVNFQYPTGISSRWEISKDATFATGQPNPSPCEYQPGHLHYLMEC